MLSGQAVNSLLHSLGHWQADCTAACDADAGTALPCYRHAQEDMAVM